MTANKHREENCYNCAYYHHDYWNCQGSEKPCHEYYPDYTDDDEAEEES